MKQEIRIKRNKLLYASLRMRELPSFAIKQDYEQNKKIRVEQDKVYKKFNFYEGLLKASDKIKSDKE
jgi:hypothetical protein